MVAVIVVVVVVVVVVGLAIAPIMVAVSAAVAAVGVVAPVVFENWLGGHLPAVNCAKVSGSRRVFRVPDDPVLPAIAQGTGRSGDDRRVFAVQNLLGNYLAVNNKDQL